MCVGGRENLLICGGFKINCTFPSFHHHKIYSIPHTNVTILFVHMCMDLADDLQKQQKRKSQNNFTARLVIETVCKFPGRPIKSSSLCGARSALLRCVSSCSKYNWQNSISEFLKFNYFKYSWESGFVKQFLPWETGTRTVCREWPQKSRWQLW